jgi:SARP family transcriptional regulator, regulator of embCAB operon
VTDAIARTGVIGFPRGPRLRRADAPAQPRFSLLGPVAVRTGDRDHTPADPRLLQVLALLMMRSGRLVHPEAIAHEVWSTQAPPPSVRSAVHALVLELRGCVEEAPSGRPVVAVRHPGYVLRVAPRRIDVLVFQQRVRQGREALRAGQHEEAARLLRSGLDLWTGDPMANVPRGPLLSAYAVELQERLRVARYLRIQAEIEAGRAEELIGELRALVAADPLDQATHVQLLQVLGAVGRRSEALALYRQLRERLIEELGVEPCEAAQRLHYDALRAGLTVR